MKLTRKIVELLKFHGYVTCTAPIEDFLARFDTLEGLANGGFISDHRAIEFIRDTFNEDGEYQLCDISEEELEKQVDETPEDKNEEVVEESETVEESVSEPEPEKTEEVVEPETVVEKPVSEPEPEKTEESENHVEEKIPEPTSTEKPKKTTTRKSTKKES